MGLIATDFKQPGQQYLLNSPPLQAVTPLLPGRLQYLCHDYNSNLHAGDHSEYYRRFATLDHD